jgi:hypothetical protein
VQFHFLRTATFDTLPHFHTRYTEYLYVSKGSILLTINGLSSTITPASGEILIPPWTPHRWEVLGGCETVVLERTVPRDGRKEAFFRNFVSLINDYGSIPKVPILQVFRVFAEWDNYPAPEAKLAREYGRGAVVALTNTLSKVAGWVGYRGMYEEYTPGELYERLSR